MDIGQLLYQSDFVLANLDEPIDTGVLTEIMMAREMNIPVIGYRSDLRTPFGDLNSFYKGTHYFALYPC